MKNKKLTAIIAMVVGAATLATAALANSGNANGYTVYKNSLKSLLNQENYTMTGSAKLLYDNQVYIFDEERVLYDQDGEVILNRLGTNKYSEEDAYTHEEYIQDGLMIYSTNARENGEKGYYVRSIDERYDDNERNFSVFNLGIGKKETEDKVINFAEALADTFVGDLKNNFVMTESDDSGSTYEMTLEAFQVPAIVTSGMDMMSAMLKERLEDEEFTSTDLEAGMMQLLASSPKIQNAKCLVKVDGEGRLTRNLLSGTIEGNGHTITLEIELNMSDYGTTQPQRLDLDNAPNVEYAKNSRKASKTYTVNTEAVSDAVKKAGENNMTITIDGEQYTAQEAFDEIPDAVANGSEIAVDGENIEYQIEQ